MTLTEVKNYDLLNSAEVWNLEYSRGTIPGSLRNDPSHVLLMFEKLLGFSRMRVALDSGCGNGRNSIYLAKLGLDAVGLDFSQNAIELARLSALSQRMEKRVIFQQLDLKNKLPFESEVFDLCLDLYTFCHFLDAAMKQQYVQELYRVTRRGGYVISALFSKKDKYYAQFLKTASEAMIISDPVNQITKELYTREKHEKSFSPPFSVDYSAEFEFADVVLGRYYRRDILAMALRK